MIELLEQSQHLLANTNLKFQRYLAKQINWANRLIGIKGARGTGKTTLLLQWLKIQGLSTEKAAYFSLDDLYFTTNSLKDTAKVFHRQGGKIMVLDEVHKYRNWSMEIKNIFDFYPDLKIIFTGSSIIDISTQQGDLSRRAVIYELPGMSFREYLAFRNIVNLAPISLDLLTTNPNHLREWFSPDFRPLEHFQEYLKFGYYPFTAEAPKSAYQKINQLVRTIVERDMAEHEVFDIRNARKLLKLVSVISQQVPFKPNLTSLAEKTDIHRNSLNSYLHYLEQAKIINLLFPAGNSISVLQKPEKIYLNNSTLQYAISGGNVEMGSIRETFFLSQLINPFKVEMPKQGDFLVSNKFTFEVGGKSKKIKQIVELDNAWMVKDDLEYPIGKALPLWMFGMLY